MSSPKRLFLIDGMALIYRSHFALIKNPLITSDGRHTSAIFGFMNSLFKLLKDEDPDYIAIVLDSKEPTFRHELFTDYKATREKMPDELVEQLNPLFQIIDYANTRGADKVIYAGYFPIGLSLERIMKDMQQVAFKDEVWPKFLRENACKVLKIEGS